MIFIFINSELGTCRYCGPMSTDGSFKKTSDTGGVGVVMRNSEGDLVVAGCEPIPRWGDAEEAEARAALFGLHLLAETQAPKAIVELDSSTVVAALHSHGQDRSSIWSTVEEAKKLLSRIMEVKIVHMLREGNRVADGLAKLANLATERVLFQNMPTQLGELLMHDKCGDPG